MAHLFEYDYLRVVCGVGVIAIHIAAGSIYFASPDPGYLNLLFFERFLSFVVPIFFFISGFLNAMGRMDSPAQFYRKKLKAVVIPYVTAFWVYWLVGVIKSGACLTVSCVIYQFFSGNVKIHLWFIPVIVQLYLIHPWVVKLPLTGRKGQLILFFLGCVELWFTCFLIYENAQVGDGFLCVLIFQGLFYYVLGVYFKENQVFDRMSIRFAAMCFGLAIALQTACAVFIYFQSLELGLMKDFGPAKISIIGSIGAIYSTLFIVALPVFVRRFCKPSVSRSNTASRIAAYTYFTYLWHVLFLSLAIRASRSVDVFFYEKWYYYVLSTIFVVGMSFGAAYAIDKYYPELNRFVGIMPWKQAQK